ncbi:hypothetical protein JW992_10080 [candidate division KSB1 bacterium]|nr:hypothetical protein [candidate division KSB1 bacterium]
MDKRQKPKIFRKKGIEWLALFLGAFALVVVLVLLLEMKKMVPDLPDEYPILPENHTVGIVDSVYYHYPFHFACPLPGPNWRFVSVSYDTILTPYQPHEAIVPQVNWLADLARPDLADARIGALQIGDVQEVKELAIGLLDEMIASAEKEGERVEILQPPTSPAHRILQGWYYALVLPQENSPVWVVSVLPRGDLVFLIWCRTTDGNYVHVRDECQALTSRFRPLLLSARPGKKL